MKISKIFYFLFIVVSICSFPFLLPHNLHLYTPYDSYMTGFFRYFLNMVSDVTPLVLSLFFITILIIILFSKKEISRYINFSLYSLFVVCLLMYFLIFAGSKMGEGALGLVPILYFLVGLIFLFLILFSVGLVRGGFKTIGLSFLSIIVILIASNLLIFQLNAQNRSSDSAKFAQLYNPASSTPCDVLPNSASSVKNDCYLNLAINKVDSSICKNITLSNIKDNCYAEVGVRVSLKTGNTEICKNIYPENLLAISRCQSGECYRMTDNKLRTQCYYDLAIKTKNGMMCSEIWNDDKSMQQCWNKVKALTGAR